MLNHPLLTAEEEKELVLLAQAGDRDAASRLIECNQRLVYKVASKFIAVGAIGDLEEADVIQIGNLGLLHAIENFEVSRGLRFSTYAVPWIKAYIDRYSQARGLSVSMTLREAESFGKVRRARSSLFQRLHHEPTIQEIARECGMDCLKVEALLNARSTVRLDDPAREPQQGGADDSETLGELIIDVPQNTEEIAETRLVFEALCEAIKQMSPRHQVILTRRFLKDTPDSYKEIGQELGLTGWRVQQIEREALTILKSQHNRP